MARIKLAFPAGSIAQVNIPVRITDINYGNHLGNDAFVGIIHEARVKWLQQHHYTELNIEGAGLILSDLAVEFKAEGFYGDIIEVEIAVGETSSISFELFYKLSVKREDKNTVLALAKTGMVCYNYQAKKVMSMPEQLNAILNR
jgi:acyl-CoA thioesterase FadM